MKGECRWESLEIILLFLNLRLSVALSLPWAQTEVSLRLHVLFFLHPPPPMISLQLSAWPAPARLWQGGWGRGTKTIQPLSSIPTRPNSAVSSGATPSTNTGPLWVHWAGSKGSLPKSLNVLGLWGWGKMSEPFPTAEFSGRVGWKGRGPSKIFVLAYFTI